MELLKERIKNDGTVLPGGVLKVDNFLNQQIDPALINEMAKELKKLYEGEDITKIVTVESSGIALASIAGLHFNAPVVFAKKTKIQNPGDDTFFTKIVSLTNGNAYNIYIPKKFISPDDKILIVDDIIANGSALKALIKICEKAGAKIAGVGVAIEKAYQNGASDARTKGIRVEALAKIKSMDEASGVEFC